MAQITVRTIPAKATHDLRRRILRAGVPDARVDIDRDHRPGAWHLGAFEGDRLVGVMSVYGAAPPPDGSGREGSQVRFMAVEADTRGRGVGRRLLEVAERELRRRGDEVVWAHARDTALHFYTRCGFTIVGPGFVHEETGLGHHVVMRDLTPEDACGGEPRIGA